MKISGCFGRFLSTSLRFAQDRQDRRFILFTVSTEKSFWASHQLVSADGVKEPLHHHDWQVKVDVSSESLNSDGLVMDFGKLKEVVKEVAGELNDTVLNENEYFQKNGCSAENVAKYVYDKLEPKLPKGVKLGSVRVGEEPGCWAKFAK